VAWRRRQTIVAGLSLLVPLALSTRYGIITGMPRGFITGVAVSIIPALLFLPAVPKRKDTPPTDGPAPKKIQLRRSWPKMRYFLAAFFAVVALMFNPNCAVLLIAVAVYGILTTFREWRFWLFSFLGLLAAAPYPLLVYYFYYVWHNDYRFYPNAARKDYFWGWVNYHEYVRTLTDFGFHDLVPNSVYTLSSGLFHWLHGEFPQIISTWIVRNPAPMAIMVAFGVTIVLLAARLRLAAILGTLAAVALVLISFAYSRIHDGRTGVSFPFSRMFLAVPVLWIWLLMLLNPPRLAANAAAAKRWRWWSWWRWVKKWVAPPTALTVLLLLAISAGTVAIVKNRALADEILDINDEAQVARPVSVEEVQDLAKAIQKIADKEHVSFVLIVGPDGRRWDYSLPELTTCETLYPSFERRTWRLVEECQPRYDKILVYGSFYGRRTAQFPTHTVVQRDPPLTLYPLNGQSVIAFCDAMGIKARTFTRPPTPPAPPPASVTTHAATSQAATRN